MVNRFIKDYLANYTNHKSYWNYEDGCVLMGSLQLYEATGDEIYKEFIFKYLDQFITNDGTINHYDYKNYNIDSINAGKVLFFCFAETNDEKYRKAIEALMVQLRSHPRIECGNFWHKKIYPNQIWLDGLYMAQPFYMAYETIFNNKANYNDIISQFVNVRQYIFDDRAGLYYHAFDESKTQCWADEKTGLSKNFWLRSMGWYLMALIDTMDVMSIEIFEHYKTLEAMFKEAIKGILQYQDDENKLFYQVIDKGEIEGNYTETSGSAMIAYAILKACRMGVLSKEKYQAIGEQVFEAIIEHKLAEEEGRINLNGICRVAGLGPDESRDGSVEYYLSEPVVCNDPKGVGPFMMAYAQKIMLNSQK